MPTFTSAIECAKLSDAHSRPVDWTMVLSQKSTTRRSGSRTTGSESFYAQCLRATGAIFPREENEYTDKRVARIHDDLAKFACPVLDGPSITHGQRSSDVVGRLAPKAYDPIHEPDKDVGHSNTCPPPLRLHSAGPCRARTGPGDEDVP